MKNKEEKSRCAEENCACDKCFKPNPQDEVRAKKFWRELYKKNNWELDNLGYLPVDNS
jgi:hypothetical protein